MKITRNALSSTLLFLGAVVLGLNYTLYWVLNFTSLQLGVRITAVALFALSALLNLNKLRFDKLYIPLFGLSVIAVGIHGLDAINMLVVLLYALATSAYDLETVLRGLIRCFLICVLFYAFLLVAGLASPVTYVSYEGRTRNTLGFEHVNAAALFFFPLLLLLSRKAAHPIRASLGVAAAYAILFMLTNTRGVVFAAFCYFIAYALFVLLGRSKHSVGMRKPLGLLIMYGIIIASIAFTQLAGSEYDLALSYRPSFYYEAIRDFTLLDWFFGIDGFSEVDNSYLVLIGHYGLIFLLCAAIVFHKAIAYFATAGKVWEFSFLLSVLAYGAIESCLYRPELVSILAFWVVVFNGAMLQSNGKTDSAADMISSPPLSVDAPLRPCSLDIRTNKK